MAHDKEHCRVCRAERQSGRIIARAKQLALEWGSLWPHEPAPPGLAEATKRSLEQEAVLERM